MSFLLTPDQIRVITDAVLWLDEHAQYMSRDVIDGYRSVQDGLVSLLPVDPRPIVDEGEEQP